MFSPSIVSSNAEYNILRSSTCPRTSRPIFQRDQFFCRNSSVSCRLFSPSTQIPPDALMAPLTVSIITTSTPTSSSFTICIYQPAQNGHQKEIFANPKGKFQACPTELDVWESKNVQPLKSKNPPRLLAVRYFFGQDISDISGYLGVESFTSHTCDDSQMYKVCSSLNLKPDQLLICILHVYNSFVAVSVNHLYPTR